MKQIIQICSPSDLTGCDKECWGYLNGYITVYIYNKGSEDYVIISKQMFNKLAKIYKKYDNEWKKPFTGKLHCFNWKIHIQILSFVDIWELKRRGEI